jgi:hypothetical protein
LSGGAQYVGEFRGGEMNGQGTLTSPDGTYQQGEFRKGTPYKASGTWIAPDGTIEVGSWNRDGTRSGGTITWKDGRRYRGDWKLVENAAELPDGPGEMRWPDGRKYAGRFRDGIMEGMGTMTYPNGKVENGFWMHDRFLGGAQ